MRWTSGSYSTISARSSGVTTGLGTGPSLISSFSCAVTGADTTASTSTVLDLTGTTAGSMTDVSMTSACSAATFPLVRYTRNAARIVSVLLDGVRNLLPLAQKRHSSPASIAARIRRHIFFALPGFLDTRNRTMCDLESGSYSIGTVAKTLFSLSTISAYESISSDARKCRSHPFSLSAAYDTRWYIPSLIVSQVARSVPDRTEAKRLSVKTSMVSSPHKRPSATWPAIAPEHWMLDGRVLCMYGSMQSPVTCVSAPVSTTASP